MNLVAILFAGGAFVVTLIGMFKLVGFWGFLLFLFLLVYGLTRR